MLRLVNVIAALLLAIAPAQARDFSGIAEVVDGDTLWVGLTKVRLHGIDAPETKQTCRSEQGVTWACGEWVSARVEQWLDGRWLSCSQTDYDRKYKRVVAICRLEGRDVGQVLVREGLAMAYRKYAWDYDLDEKAAAVADRGLHAMRLQSPEQFRRTRAVGRIPPRGGCRIKGNISSAGERIYHMPGQRHYEVTGIREERGELWFCSETQAVAAGWRAARR